MDKRNLYQSSDHENGGYVWFSENNKVYIMSVFDNEWVDEAKIMYPTIESFNEAINIGELIPFYGEFV